MHHKAMQCHKCYVRSVTWHSFIVALGLSNSNQTLPSFFFLKKSNENVWNSLYWYFKKKKSWLSGKFSYYEFIPCGNDKFKDKTVTIT